MVVAEAMACGTPALVSTQTGAKAIIEETPGSGWIVEPDGDALLAQLRQLILEPAQLENAREQAQRAAELYTWQAYRRRATKLLSEALC
jgi:glycosyltransferase involved in cell wall biosynthesis